MKTFLILSIFTIIFAACDPKANMDSDGAGAKVKAPEQQSAQAKPMEETKPSEGGFVEENNMCICTKDFRPVCGSNGQTYPNACQAGCEGIKEYTEGPCKK